MNDKLKRNDIDRRKVAQLIRWLEPRCEADENGATKLDGMSCEEVARAAADDLKFHLTGKNIATNAQAWELTWKKPVRARGAGAPFKQLFERVNVLEERVSVLEELLTGNQR